MSDQQPPALAHMVYFTLSDAGDTDRLLAGCRKFLTDHPGTLHYFAGRRAEDYERPVNDTHHHVALILVFASQADHDRYQGSERHQQFLAEYSPLWSRVQVFDDLV
jgi:hypothetical protein